MIEKKTEKQLFEQLQQVLKNININFDVSPSSIDYLANQKYAQLLAIAYEYAQQALQAVDIYSANLEQTKNIFYMLGIPMLAPQKSSAKLTATGTAGTVIAAGSQFKDVNDNTWVSTELVTIDENASNYIPVESQAAGAFTADINSINIIVGNIPGLESVTNEEIAAVGRNAETLKDLRDKYSKTLYRNSENTIQSLESLLYEISGVTSVFIIANRSDKFLNIISNSKVDTDDNDCIAPRSTIIYIDGGDEDEIIESIANKYSVAEHLNQGRDSKLNGTEVTKTYATPQRTLIINGSERLIGGYSSSEITFYRAQSIDISIKFTIHAKENLIIAEQTIDLIKQSIIDFAQGELFDDDNVEGYDKTGYQIGEDVIASQLATPINKILGVSGYFTGLNIGYSNTWNQDSITIPTGSIAKFDVSRIEITEA